MSRRPRQRPPDPFAALGLTAAPELTDDDVRAAWRRVAAATHPDRSDGGDPAQFAAAAAAYTELRTRFGRGEAMADAGAGRRRVWFGRGKAVVAPRAGGRRLPGARRGTTGEARFSWQLPRAALLLPGRCGFRAGSAADAQVG